MEVRHMITLENGAKVVAADLTTKDGVQSGFVLAEWHGEFVTWRVGYYDGAWHSSWGHYWDRYDKALADYNERRQGTDGGER